MIEFIKKYGIGFLLSTIIFGPLGYVTATTISARNVYYNGANTNSSLTNVQGAIEQLYNMAEGPTPEIQNITYGYSADGTNIYIDKENISLSSGEVSNFFVSNDNKNTYVERSSWYGCCFGDNQNHDFYVYVVTTNGKTTEPYKITVYMGSCFTGDTKVKSENGYTNIEDIKVGDKVYSYNEITKTEELKDVTKTFIHDDNRIYEIKAGKQIVKVTPDHRIYVKAKYGNTYEWTKVYNIHEGDYLLDSNNKQVRIDSIKYYESKDDLKVYNIEVADNHTYYISDGNFLVHNAKGEYCENPGEAWGS